MYSDAVDTVLKAVLEGMVFVRKPRPLNSFHGVFKESNPDASCPSLSTTVQVVCLPNDIKTPDPQAPRPPLNKRAEVRAREHRPPTALG